MRNSSFPMRWLLIPYRGFVGEGVIAYQCKGTIQHNDKPSDTHTGKTKIQMKLHICNREREREYTT